MNNGLILMPSDVRHYNGTNQQAVATQPSVRQALGHVIHPLYSDYEPPVVLPEEIRPDPPLVIEQYRRDEHGNVTIVLPEEKQYD
jgi:hypothetical protein